MTHGELVAWLVEFVRQRSGDANITVRMLPDRLTLEVWSDEGTTRLSIPGKEQDRGLKARDFRKVVEVGDWAGVFPPCGAQAVELDLDRGLVVDRRPPVRSSG